jgi:ABC-type uncharacterized transport system auxiliary subunit
MIINMKKLFCALATAVALSGCDTHQQSPEDQHLTILSQMSGLDISEIAPKNYQENKWVCAKSIPQLVCNLIVK